MCQLRIKFSFGYIPLDSHRKFLSSIKHVLVEIISYEVRSLISFITVIFLSLIAIMIEIKNFRHAGVRCVDTLTGYECGPCPPGWTGNGVQCEDACAPQPCHPGVRCDATSHAPYFKCAPCPKGFTGDGITCTDIDEVLFIRLFTLFLAVRQKHSCRNVHSFF